MIPTNNQRSLIDLGDGVYTVSEICRILQPTMTPRKAHYWLDTGLLTDPVRRDREVTPRCSHIGSCSKSELSNVFGTNWSSHSRGCEMHWSGFWSICLPASGPS